MASVSNCAKSLQETDSGSTHAPAFCHVQRLVTSAQQNGQKAVFTAQSAIPGQNNATLKEWYQKIMDFFASRDNKNICFYGSMKAVALLSDAGTRTMVQVFFNPPIIENKGLGVHHHMEAL